MTCGACNAGACDFDLRNRKNVFLFAVEKSTKPSSRSCHRLARARGRLRDPSDQLERSYGVTRMFE
jgi:hypothetical protein